jgi:hypothetical protein
MEAKDMYIRAQAIAEQRTGMPAYLCDDEDWYAAVEEARAELGITERAPVCSHCGEVAPYGDERHQWLSAHNNGFHRGWWKIKRKLGWV